MGWFSSLVHDVGTGVSGKGWGHSFDVSGPISKNTVKYSNYGSGLIGTLAEMTKKSGPGSPGIDGNLQNLQSAQNKNATDFRANIPGMENTLTGDLKSQINQQLQGDTSNLKSANSSRGLLYGGVNAGGENALRSNADQSFAKGSMQINQGLLNQADKFDRDAISTGLAVQGQSQQLQNSIYQNAMANMNATNSIYSSGLGAITKAFTGS